MNKLTEKTPKSAAERKYLQRQGENKSHPEEYQRKENERLKLLRWNQKAKMSIAELNEKCNKDRARQALYWQKKNEEKAKNNVVLSLKVKIYKTPQAYGKALKKSLTALPNSPRKKSEIVRGLAKSVGLQLEWCMQKELDSETKQKYEIMKQFFFFFWKRLSTLPLGWKTMSLYMKVEKNNGFKNIIRPSSWGKHSVSSRQEILKLVLALQHFAS